MSSPAQSAVSVARSTFSSRGYLTELETRFGLPELFTDQLSEGSRVVCCSESTISGRSCRWQVLLKPTADGLSVELWLLQTRPDSFLQLSCASQKCSDSLAAFAFSTQRPFVSIGPSRSSGRVRVGGRMCFRRSTWNSFPAFSRAVAA